LQRRRINSTRKGEEGIVVLLVAMFLLFVVGAMAALAVDLVTFYTARSEAQQAADGAALAGARAMANSGMTSADPLNTLLVTNAEDLARTIATQVAVENKVGGAVPSVNVTFNDADHNDPQIIVQVSRTDLPVFFSRIWGNTAATVKASATAEAYNPSGLNTAGGLAPPVALTCVKPWLLPNRDPSKAANSPIFDVNTGRIASTATGLLGWNSAKSPPPSAGNLQSACPNGDCTTGGLPSPSAWRYYPGKVDSSNFPPPTQSVPSCPSVSTTLTDYQKSIAGCVPKPISCYTPVPVDIDTIPFPARAQDTADAVNCLTHAAANLGDGDVADPLPLPDPAPFTFTGGNQNPIASAKGKRILVSDSLVTVPVIDDSGLNSGSTTATVIGFVQLFLNADGAPAPNVDPAPIQTKIVNMIGCGANATGQPIQGNGTSAVTVRLIAPQ
jgi:hypothetical protein